MPTCDEDGPSLLNFPTPEAARRRAFVDELRDCAVQAHADWQEALAVSTAAAQAAREGRGGPSATYLFDRSVAAHQTAKLAEGVYNRAREAWFQLDAEALAKFKRRFRFEDCVARSASGDET